MPKIPPRKPEALEPFWQTTDGRTVRLYQGDVIDVLRQLPGNSVHTVVTSPPYWGLRDYGTGEWEGGDPECAHSQPEEPNGNPGRNNTNWDNRHGLKPVCPKCGAKRVDRQLGSEKSPDCLGWAKGENCAERDWDTACHVCRMVLVFRAVHRVLRDDGTVWLNYGDSYSGGSGGLQTNSDKQKSNGGTMIQPRKSLRGIPSGNLVGVPWRVALALQADGWILRQDVIWAKPSPMPESVRNRCTKAHEYVFLLAKRAGYFYDAEAIRESSSDPTGSESRYKFSFAAGEKNQSKIAGEAGVAASLTNPYNGGMREFDGGRNKRSVWSVSSAGYPGAHFATFPPKLIEPMILAGTSERGCCAKCGAPWKRVVEQVALKRKRPNDYVKRTGAEGTGNSCANSVAGVDTKTIGWLPTCECFGRFETRTETVTGQAVNETAAGGIPNGWAVGQVDHSAAGYAKDGVAVEDKAEQRERAAAIADRERVVKVREYVPSIHLDAHPTVSAIVLDPFVGSGTTCAVALATGRHSVGIDLSPKYLRDNAVPRIEGELLQRPAMAHLAGRKRERVDFGEAPEAID